MSFTPANIVAPAYVANSSTAIYTVPSSTRASVKSITLHNANASAETWTLNWGVGGAASSASNLVRALSIPANTSIDVDFPFPLIMSATDKLYSGTTTASKVTITVNGTTEAV